MFKNIGSNWILNVVNLVVMLLMMRYVVGAIGVDVNGVWENVVTSAGFLTLVVLGVPMTSVRWFSQALARNDHEALNKAIATCLGAYVILGVGGVVMGLGFFAGFEAWTVPKIVETLSKSGVDPTKYVESARFGFWIVTFSIAFGFISQVPFAILAAHRDFGPKNKVMIASLLFRLGATYAFVRPGARSLTTLALVVVLCTLVEFAASYAMIRRRYPYVRVGFAGFDRKLLREILGFSVYVLLLNLGNRLVFQTSGLVVVWNGDASLADATVFEKAKAFVLPISEFVLSIAAVVMPTVVKLRTEGSMDELKGVMLRWSKLALAVALLPGLYLAVFGTEFFAAYVITPPNGKAFDSAAAGSVQLVLLLAHFAYLPVRGVALPILTGIGKPERATVAFLLTGLLNLALSLVLLPRAGLIGVAWGMFIPLALFSAYLLHLACREIELSPLVWLKYVGLKPALGAAAVVGASLAIKRWIAPESLFALVATGGVYVCLFAAAWILFVHRGDPFVDFLAQIRARFSRRASA